MALPQKYRLRSPRSFTQVYRQGQRASGSCVVAKALRVQTSGEGPLKPSPDVCFGISISRKVHKRAVVRNRIKRQIHGALMSLLPRLRGHYWVVINVRRAAVTCEYYDLLRELESLLVKLEVLDGH